MVKFRATATGGAFPTGVPRQKCTPSRRHPGCGKNVLCALSICTAPCKAACSESITLCFENGQCRLRKIPPPAKIEATTRITPSTMCRFPGKRLLSGIGFSAERLHYDLLVHPRELARFRQSGDECSSRW